MIRKLDPSEQARIAAAYGVDPGNITTLVHTAPPSHGTADLAPPMTPSDVVKAWYRNRARVCRMQAAMDAQILATWGDE